MSYYSNEARAKEIIENTILEINIKNVNVSYKKFMRECIDLKVSKKFIQKCLDYHIEKGEIKIVDDDIIPIQHDEIIKKREQEAEKILNFKLTDDNEE